jgi:hypothetical protein
MEEECTVLGPTEVPAGDVTFVLRDLSGTNQNMYVVYYTEGDSHQKLVDAQGPPGRWWPIPDWLDYAKVTSVVENEGRNEEYWTLSLEAGEHSITLGSSGPPRLWLCARLVVID